MKIYIHIFVLVILCSCSSSNKKNIVEDFEKIFLENKENYTKLIQLKKDLSLKENISSIELSRYSKAITIYKSKKYYFHFDKLSELESDENFESVELITDAINMMRMTKVKKLYCTENDLLKSYLDYCCLPIELIYTTNISNTRAGALGLQDLINNYDSSEQYDWIYKLDTNWYLFCFDDKWL